MKIPGQNIRVLLEISVLGYRLRRSLSVLEANVSTAFPFLAEKKVCNVRLNTSNVNEHREIGNS